MRINNNLQAMNTHRQLGISNTAGAKSMEKLSSGFRINRAGDDAAGLAISEKMRGQIRGLNQASRNAQDGISLIQTAEGALNETHAILQRMRELTVQAATDTNTVDDRAKIQAELDQLTSEIDRIGNTTEFNTMKLINGEQSQKANATANASNLGTVKVISPQQPGEYTVAVANKADVVANFNAGAGLVDTNITFGSAVDIGSSFNLIVSNYDSGANTADIALQDGAGNIIGTAITGADLTGAITIGGNDGVVIAAGAITANGTASFDFGVSADYSISFNGVTTHNLTGVETTNGKVEVGGFEITVGQNLANGSNTVTVEGESLQLQVGANENQSVRLGIGDMRSEALGVNNLDVSSHAKAKSAITTVNNALEDVSRERSKLGAMQNRLEHTIKNLDTSAENLQASEARIRDVDMAKEMMEQTKQGILQQAATAMLAQANQAPQTVLQLLR